MAKESKLNERLNTPMRIFIGGKFIGESNSTATAKPAKNVRKRPVKNSSTKD